jgi:hypothetical protein
LVKFPGDSKVYAVTKGGVLRHVTSEAIAAALYGNDWYKQGVNLDVIPEGFRANYTEGTPITAASDYDKAAAMAASPDISTDKGLASAPSTSGALTVALATDNPAGAVLPSGAAGVTLLKFNLSAGSSPVTINSLTFKRSNVGNPGDFPYVYLYEGNTRLTTGRSIRSTDNLVEFTGLNISVPANSTKTLSAVVDVATNAMSGDVHALSLTAVGTTATVSGLPVIGNAFSIGSQSVGSLTVKKGTAPSNPTVGQKGVAISEFRLENSGSSDMTVYRVTLVQAGDIPNTDLTNLELYQGSTKVASTPALSGDKINFVFDSPYTIPQGTTRVFTVKADVSGYSNRRIRTYVEYSTDVYAVDSKYGFGAQVDISNFDRSNYIEVTTQGGKLTVAFNGPSAGDIAIASQDAVLYKFALTAGDQAVEVRNVRVQLSGVESDALLCKANTYYLTDISLKNLDSGARIDSKELSSDVSNTCATPAGDKEINLVFNNPFTIEAGKTVNLAVTADIANTSDFTNFVGKHIKVTLKSFSSGDVKEVNTNQDVTNIVPSADIGGNQMKITSSSLTVAVASTPVSGTTVKGSTGVPTVGFAFTAGPASDIKVTKLVLSGKAASSTASTSGYPGLLDDIVISARLYDGDTAISDLEAPSSDGTITFNNLNWTIPAGSTKKLVVKVNLATTLIDATTSYFYLGIKTGDVTAQDKDGNTLSNVPGSDTNYSSSGNINDSNRVYTTVRPSGTLSVSLDGDTPLSTIIVGGTNDVVMAKFKFTSTYESFLVKKLTISIDDANDTTGIAQVKVSYPTQSGSIEEKTGVFVGTNANFSDLNFYVKQDVSNILTVKVDLSPISQSGISGDTPQVILDYNDNFEAVGQSSGTTLTSVGSNDIAGNPMIVRKTKPTVTLASGSPSGAGVPGLNEVLRFTVSADAGGDIELARLTFRVVSTDNAPGGSGWNTPNNGNGLWTNDFKLYDASDLSTPLNGTWVLFDANGKKLGEASTSVVTFARFDFTTNKTIAAGTSKTFVLKVDTSGASSAHDDSVRFDVLGDTTSTLANFDNTPDNDNEIGSYFVWGETGSGATTANRGNSSDNSTGITGYLVKNLDVIGGTIVY